MTRTLSHKFLPGFAHGPLAGGGRRLGVAFAAVLRPFLPPPYFHAEV
jgi:hypothetical protein